MSAMPGIPGDERQTRDKCRERERDGERVGYLGLDLAVANGFNIFDLGLGCC